MAELLVMRCVICRWSESVWVTRQQLENVSEDACWWAIFPHWDGLKKRDTLVALWLYKACYGCLRSITKEEIQNDIRKGR